MSTTVQMPVLKLSEIKISETNPRKRFDENALAELAQSIAKVGVLQPILVRPQKKGYQLVCGERRYRASLLAGKDDILVNIRNMTDDEAFELQIIENLERKDVHPMDEADAFAKMIKSGRYNITDIAAKMAKPETFIMQRLKLNDLIPEIKQDFFDDLLAIGHANLIARLVPEHQKDIYKDYKDGWDTSGYGTVDQLKEEIAEKTYDLNRAVFSLEGIYKDVPACTACAHRSSNRPLLFNDMQGQDTCFIKRCFKAKTNEYIENEVLDIIAMVKDIYIARSHGDDASAEIKAIADQYSIPILKHYEDFFDTNTPHWKMREIEVFYVSGEKRGIFAKVWLKEQSEEMLAFGPSELGEIEKIETKAKRALELDEQKIHAVVVDALKVEFDKKVPLEFTFDQEFIDAMILYLAIENIGFYSMNYDFQNFGIDIKRDYNNLDELQADMLRITPKQKVQILARLLYKKTAFGIDGHTLHGQIARKLAKYNPNIPVTQIEASQHAAAAKRIAKAEQRLKALKK